MRTENLEWAKRNINKVQSSPRKKFRKGKPPQDFKIVDVNDEGKRIKIQFLGARKTVLTLEFWRFDKALELIPKKGWIRLGTSLRPQDERTLEYQLQKYAKRKYNRKSDTKTAPHICDILALSKLVKYISVRNPNTGRQTQAVTRAQ